MSDEPEGLIEDVFINKLGAKYPFVKGKNCNGKYAITGFPTFVVIGADGLVAQIGMPGESELEKLLETATVTPKLPDEPRYEPLRALYKKGEFGKVREYLDKQLATPALDPAMKDVFTAHHDSVDKRMASATTRVATLAGGPDYAASEVQLEKVEKQWKGLPPADAATKELARFAADPMIKKEVSAGKALEKVLASFDPGKTSQRKKLIEALEQFGKKYGGTFAGKQADEQRAQLTATK